MTDDTILERLDAILQELQRQQRNCPQYPEHLVEFEKLHGELKSQGTRMAVYEGNVQSELSRVNHRLDELSQEIRSVSDKQTSSDARQQAEIDKLALHSRYIMGIAAGVIFLISFFDKIKRFFLGGTP